MHIIGNLPVLLHHLEIDDNGSYTISKMQKISNEITTMEGCLLSNEKIYYWFTMCKYN